ncbi:MAG TPA: universal stress protein [Pirellulaceae bacterium]|jgi:nucleotide-binding universal stress UspA family protein|nr:universal stress protein [Pirellulaceae bacterium]
MNFKKILCPTDFSDYSRAALEMAAALARESDAELILLHAADTPMSYAADDVEMEEDKALQEIQKRLDQVAIAVAPSRVRRLLAEGDPGAAIVDVARDESADLIVISTHGRSGWSRLLMGSTAEYVVRNAGCPVLSLRSSEGGPTPA